MAIITLRLRHKAGVTPGNATKGFEMSDLINEVDDDMRRQQLDKFWLENKNWIIGGIILAIVTTAGLTWWRTWDFQRNVTQTQELRQIVDKDNAASLTAYAKESDRNHAALAKLMAAGMLSRDGKTDEAAKIYDDLGGTLGADSTLRDLAKLQSIGLRLNRDDAKKLHKELEDISGDHDAFRYSALEMDALLYARENKLQEAIERLTKITSGSDAPDDVRTRAVTLRELYTATLNAAASQTKGK